MSQPFFEEMETDGMMLKNPCVEDTTRHQLLQLTASGDGVHQHGVRRPRLETTGPPSNAETGRPEALAPRAPLRLNPHLS